MYALGVALHGPSEHYPRPDAEGEPQCTRDRLVILSKCSHGANQINNLAPGLLAACSRSGHSFEIVRTLRPALSLCQVAVGSVQLDA